MKFIFESNFCHIICEQKTLIVFNLDLCVIIQLFDALKYLHNLEIIHRDIRLNNFIVVLKQSLHIKLTRFEFSFYDKNTFF